MNTAWCPSCGCGWDSDPLPFQVKPPEDGCKVTECDCHESFWWHAQKPNMEQLEELEKRYLWGDR